MKRIAGVSFPLSLCFSLPLSIYIYIYNLCIIVLLPCVLNLNPDADDYEPSEPPDGAVDDEHEAILAEEAALEAMEECGREEVLGFSSSEEELPAMVPAGATRVKSFSHRAAYQKLESLGLVALPPGGLHLSYHTSTRTWTGYHPVQGSKNLCFTHGGELKRTEGECLLLVIRGLLKLHLDRFPRDPMWKAQYEKVLNVLATKGDL